VRAWLEHNADRIQMFFLPPYSPDLNPDEMLNNDVKANAVGSSKPRNQPQLLRSLRSYLNRRRNNAKLVKRYFHEESVRYAAA
jgi:transposase